MDYLDGDPVIPEDTFEKTEAKYYKWLPRHGPEATRPLVDKVIDGLKEQAITKVAAAGYCFVSLPPPPAQPTSLGGSIVIPDEVDHSLILFDSRTSRGLDT